jgi:hypothetical protein
MMASQEQIMLCGNELRDFLRELRDLKKHNDTSRPFFKVDFKRNFAASLSPTRRQARLQLDEH